MADALDPAALEALWGEGLLDAALPPAGPPLPPAERAAKRMREAELSLDAHLAFEAGARAPGDDARAAPADSGDDGAPAGRGGRKGSADGAAKAKANRERARRERLNDFFAELVRAMEPATPHAVVRTDKASIVADAIRLITALRAENGQLRQLNKFMEARLAALERERAEAMVRAAYAAGAAAGGGGAAAALSPGAGPSSAPAPPPAAAPDLGALLPPADVDTSADGVRRPPAA